MPTVAIHPPKTPVHKGSHAIAAASIPNVCKMPGPPAPFIPAPLPNIAKSELSPKDYSSTVKIEGNTVAIRGSTFESIGDMASKGTGGGLISANCHGPAKFIVPGSMTVKIEGKNVHLLGDSMLNNLGASGSPPNTGATMMGAAQAPGPASINADCEAAMAEAQRLADEAQNEPGATRPNKISVIRNGNGQMVAGRNGGGNTPAVEACARAVPRQNVNNCQCSELNALSNAETGGTNVDGAVVATVNVRGPNATGAAHGTREAACNVCNIVLMDYNVTEC